MPCVHGLGAFMGLAENLDSKILLVCQITLDKIIGERNGWVWDMFFFFGSLWRGIRFLSL